MTTRSTHTPGPWWMAAIESRPAGAYAVGDHDYIVTEIDAAIAKTEGR